MPRAVCPVESTTGWAATSRPIVGIQAPARAHVAWKPGIDGLPTPTALPQIAFHQYTSPFSAIFRSS